MHNRNTYQMVILLAVVALLSSACRTPAPPPLPSPTDTPTLPTATPMPPTPTPEPAISAPELPPADPDDQVGACALIPQGPCYYPHFPAIEGYTQTYRVSDGITGRTRMQTRTIGEVWEDGFNYILIDEQVSAVMECICLPQGLLINDMQGLIEGVLEGLRAEGESFETVYVEFDGVTQAENISPGDTWESTMRWAMSPGTAAETFLFVTTSEFIFVGMEVVQVPAGIFEARRIDSTVTVSFGPILDDGTFLNVGSIESNNTAWNAECVGVVKTVGVVAGIETVVELVEYRLP